MVAESKDGSSKDDQPPGFTSALQHDKRYQLIECLLEEGEQGQFQMLANHILSTSDGTYPEIMYELHNVHVPKLEAAEVIEFEDESGIISLTADTDSVETALASIEKEDQ